MYKLLGKYHKGCIKDSFDYRDFKYIPKLEISVDRPTSVDLRGPFMPDVYDQGNLGSCVSNAVMGSFQYLRRKEAKPDYMWSRLFNYWHSRVLESTPLEDSGCMIRDGIKTIATKGSCKESTWPYLIYKFKTCPSNTSFGEAEWHKGLKYESVNQSQTVMETRLFEGFPIIIGVDVYESFESSQVATTGYVPMPNIHREKYLGGHAMLVCGYDSILKLFLIRNSWGTGFGDKGYLYMPYDYLFFLGNDYWTMELVS